MSTPGPIAIGIHGGCGTLAPELLSEAVWGEMREHLAQALRAGWRLLQTGANAVEAVEAAVVVMEDSPHFNAGHGAALTDAAEHELDASIMDGERLAAGAICMARRIRNPIRAARAVMERSDCVLLAGAAADAFAERQGLAMVANDYFTTQRRVDALASLRARAVRGTLAAASEAERHGTVGAVALDAAGRLAAATSTGGFNNKPAGRIGDSPIIGAGTYAQNGVCAVSCTGQGEYFIRHVVAHEIAARIRLGGDTLVGASDDLIHRVMTEHGIGAGLVAVNGAGRVHAPFNTLGMARGWISPDGLAFVATHREVHKVAP
jgi:beta-aspartyl-peptidase (threonine type)